MLIPYLQIPSLPPGRTLAIHPFGVLVATGIMVGAWLTRKRGERLGLKDEMVRSMIFYSVLTGFIVAHAVDVVVYQDGTFEQKFWAFLNPQSGLSSMGGFAGAVLGLWLWCRRNGEEVLAYADSLAYGLALGWMFGRLGCFVAHDHPGHLTSFFLGVDYPCPKPACYPVEGLVYTNSAFRRHDLGFYEALIAAVLTTFYLVMERFVRPRKGFYVAAIALYYGPVRFFLDYLRASDISGADPRYFGLTPGQYAAVAITVVGVLLAVWVSKKPAATPASS
jgi:phosphatidylglycerol:prolipoprotein diacylglycerol transferase